MPLDMAMQSAFYILYSSFLNGAGRTHGQTDAVRALTYPSLSYS